MRKHRYGLYRIISFIALLLAVVMVLGLAGCGDDDDEDTYAGDNTPTASAPIAQSTQQATNTSLLPYSNTSLSFKPAESSFKTTDNNVRAIEVNQGLSYGRNADTGNLYLIDAFVAGRETAVFVAFNQKTDVTADGSMRLTIYHNDKEVATLLPTAAKQTDSAYFFPKNLSDVGNWAEGAYRFVFTSDSGEAERTTNFYKSRKLKVLAVPMVCNYSGKVVGVNGEWKTAWDHLYATYPIGKGDLEYILGSELDVSDKKYDLNTEDGMYNVWNALTKLQTKNKDYDLIIGYAREMQGDNSILGYTYGFPATIVTENSADYAATVSHEVAHVYGIGDEYPGGSLATGVNMPPYNMEGRDMESGKKAIGTNPNIKGGNDIGLNECGSIIYDQQRPFNLRTQQILKPATSYMGWGCADSYLVWTTSDIWNHIFTKFTGVGNIGSDYSEPEVGDNESGEDGGSWYEDEEWDYTGTPSDDSADEDWGGDYDYYDDGGVYEDDEESWGVCWVCDSQVYPEYVYGECTECEELTEIENYEGFECDSCGEWNDFDVEYLVVECNNCESLVYYEDIADQTCYSRAAKTSASYVNAIDIFGTLYENGTFEKSPWYTYETERSNLKMGTKGNYAAVIYDKDGNALVTERFYMSFVANGTPPRAVDRMPVNLTMRYPDNAARIAITKDDKEIFSQTISVNVPVVEFVGMSDYQNVTDNATISWKGSDSDGDKLYYELWYCVDEEESYMLASDIEETSYMVDLTALPGADEGYFYLYASDGVLTGEIDSPYVVVDYKKPEIMTVWDKPQQFKITEEIYLDVDVYDLQDGWLYTDDEVVWMLDGKDYQTSSAVLIWPYEVKPGKHILTMTATNSAGMSVMADYIIEVLDDESDLPNDWSRADIKQALENGFVANISDSNAAITRIQAAYVLETLFYYMDETDQTADLFENYDEAFIKDCGNDDGSAYIMVKLGLMEAPNGMFNPYGNMTEKAFAELSYRTLYKADPEYMDDLNTIDEIVSFCYDNGVMDKTGDNAYNPDAKLTVAKMLVRVNRLYNAIFEN